MQVFVYFLLTNESIVDLLWYHTYLSIHLSVCLLLTYGSIVHLLSYHAYLSIQLSICRLLTDGSIVHLLSYHTYLSIQLFIWLGRLHILSFLFPLFVWHINNKSFN
jgi:hypothetical protein